MCSIDRELPRVRVVDGDDARCRTADRQLQLATGPPPALDFDDSGVRYIQLDDDTRIRTKRHRPVPCVLARQRSAPCDKRSGPQPVLADRSQAVDGCSVKDDHVLTRTKTACQRGLRPLAQSDVS